MRNTIVSILIVIFIGLLCYSIFHGIDKGPVKILSFEQLKDKNKKTIEKLEEAEKLTNTDYPESIVKLDKAFSEYKLKKENYEQLSGFSEKEKIKKYETKQYDISYLWRILGNYAEKRNLKLGMDVKSSSKVNSLYSYNFTVEGEYADIMRFISELENDSDLYFRIYNFKMTGQDTRVTASFKVENINIDASTIQGAKNSGSANLFK